MPTAPGKVGPHLQAALPRFAPRQVKQQCQWRLCPNEVHGQPDACRRPVSGQRLRAASPNQNQASLEWASHLRHQGSA